MAVEKDPGSKGEFEKPTAPDPDEAKRLRDELAAEKRAREEERAQLAAALKDPATVKALHDQVMGQQQPQKPEPEEDDTALVDRKELKRFADDIKRTVAGVVVENTAHASKLTRSNTKELMRGKLKNFDKYEKEIDSLLDKMDPRIAAQPDTIQKVYKVVRSDHIEEELEEAERSRGANREDAETEFPLMEEEAESRKVAGGMSGTLPTARHSGGVAPTGDASASRPVSSRRETTSKPLSRDERVAAQLFGIQSAEEFRRYGDPNWKPDLLGSKGRSRF